MTTKTFNQQLHDSVDPQSREVIINYMKSRSFPFHSNPNKFGLDLISDFKDKDGKLIGLELEHREIWDREIYPYTSIHIPARKLKFLGTDQVHYIVIACQFTRIGLCLGHTLKYYLGICTEVPNSAVHHNEYFLHVPREEFVWKSILEC